MMHAISLCSKELEIAEGRTVCREKNGLPGSVASVVGEVQFN